MEGQICLDIRIRAVCSLSTLSNLGSISRDLAMELCISKLQSAVVEKKSSEMGLRASFQIFPFPIDDMDMSS